VITTFPQRCAVVTVLLGATLLQPHGSWAHSKGLYATRAEAEQRASQLGCDGVHENNGRWMPCSDEAMLHKELRKE
jgi:hypothetical protein